MCRDLWVALALLASLTGASPGPAGGESSYQAAVPLLASGLQHAGVVLNLARCRFAAGLTGASPGPAGGESSYQAAVPLLASGRLREALPYLEDAYKGGLQHAGVVLNLARCRFAAGQDGPAVDLVDEAVRRSSSPNLLLESGKVLFEWVLYRHALGPLKKAWELNPGSYETGMYLALAHYLLDQYEQSYAVLAKMRAGTFEYRNLLGAVSARVDRWQAAKDQFQLAIQEAPDRAEGYLNLGLLCLERGDDAAAAELFDQGAARLRTGTKVFYRIRTRPNCAGLVPPDPARKPDRDRAKSYTTFALALQKAQHWQSALEVYLLALKSDPQAIRAYGGIGLVCQELGTPEVGKVFLERGLELSPGDAELNYYLGSVMEALGSPGEAQGRYEKAVRLREPEVPAAYLVRLGSVLLLAGREADAEASFLRAIRRDPDHARAHHELGKLHLKRREYRLAEESLGIAVRLDPLLSEAQYAYGLACLRNGKAAAGKMLLENHRRKKELRTTVGTGTLPVNPQ